LGQTVFALHPHQTLFDIPADMAIQVPASVTPRRAVLAANMETALNAVWDSGAGPGDRILVVGAGVVGLLIAWICARLPGAEDLLIDVAFNCPGRAEGLAAAIGQAGFEATVVEASWHGAEHSPIPLGGAFHSQRLRLISSQVGAVAASRRPRWSYRRRLSKALDLLADPALDALLAWPVSFEELPQALGGVLDPKSSALCPLIRYPAVDGPGGR
jgi:threonine dehydrogenase-like Zn-dependent dehydrogenase